MQEPLSNTRFYGDGYDPAVDHTRLTGNLEKVRAELVKSVKWEGATTLKSLSTRTGVPEASVSAALRTLRNEHGYVISKKRKTEESGTWLYWISGKGEKPKPKMKAVGDPALFGEMMRSIYAAANAPEYTYEDELKDLRWKMHRAAAAWCNDMVVRTKRTGTAEIIAANETAAKSTPTREMGLDLARPDGAARRKEDANG